MKQLADQIKQALGALALADVGEVSGRRRMEEILNPNRTPTAAPLASRRRQIALGIGDSLPAPVMEYVIGVCRRMQADLLLLCTDATRVRALLADYLPDLKGISCEAEELNSCSRRAGRRVLQRRSDVLFAVTGTSDDPVSHLVRGRRGLLDNQTPVPVVVIGEPPARVKPGPSGAARRQARPVFPLVSQP